MAKWCNLGRGQGVHLHKLFLNDFSASQKQNINADLFECFKSDIESRVSTFSNFFFLCFIYFMDNDMFEEYGIFKRVI